MASIPVTWKKVTLTPAIMYGDRAPPESSRLVILTNTQCKVREFILMQLPETLTCDRHRATSDHLGVTKTSVSVNSSAQAGAGQLVQNAIFSDHANASI
ncbi:hypothetical protein T265_12176 [Opisthorchis viverrini]|uniref:Uncharacterized protein n=1 Tax=Opisthorchis viverrini TaxID=6198 RepID=A0A074YVE5_OPIVI|nr:hypothetical protein T265_12176 [Opisthorchis viverrini]KER18731.1 hypothetical protein T265_12176 [Opisthorchis viverrini]